MCKVYILKCSDGSYYTGWTTDIERRLSEHNAGKGAKYTRGRTPCTLVYTADCSSTSEALKLEAKIKKLNREKKIQLIQEKRDL